MTSPQRIIAVYQISQRDRFGYVAITDDVFMCNFLLISILCYVASSYLQP